MDNLILEFIIKNWEIDLPNELLKKYSINAVNIKCTGKYIPFMEREMVIVFLEALSISHV